jgi:hypothetical protein
MSRPGGWQIGYAFALDAVEIRATPAPFLSRGEMEVTLISELDEIKEIQGVNLPTNTVVSSVASWRFNPLETMKITRRGPGMACNEAPTRSSCAATTPGREGEPWPCCATDRTSRPDRKGAILERAFISSLNCNDGGIVSRKPPTNRLPSNPSGTV